MINHLLRLASDEQGAAHQHKRTLRLKLTARTHLSAASSSRLIWHDWPFVHSRYNLILRIFFIQSIMYNRCNTLLWTSLHSNSVWWVTFSHSSGVGIFFFLMSISFMKRQCNSPVHKLLKTHLKSHWLTCSSNILLTSLWEMCLFKWINYIYTNIHKRFTSAVSDN